MSNYICKMVETLTCGGDLNLVILSVMSEVTFLFSFFMVKKLLAILDFKFCVCHVSVRQECQRPGPAGPVNVTVKVENPPLTSPLLGLALPWCEEWTACQVE